MARPRKDATPATPPRAARTPRKTTPRKAPVKAAPNPTEAEDTLQQKIDGLLENENTARRSAISTPPVDRRIAELEAKVNELTALLGAKVAEEAVNAGRVPMVDFGEAVRNGDGQVLKDGDVIHIHFVEDGGPSFKGKPNYRGFELQVVVGSTDYESTVNPATGRSWLTYTAKEQYALWGTHKFSPGPWPGGPLGEDDIGYGGPSKEDIEEQRRQRLS